MTVEDCIPCNQKICDCCNGTGKVPEGKQRRPNWWISEGPVSPETWCKTLFESCVACIGTGKVRK